MAKREFHFFSKGSKMKKITVIAVKWFDKVNGNTYHSVRIIRHRDGKELFCQFQYGYGDQYRHTALMAMKEAGWIRKEIMSYERTSNYPIIWNVSDGLKRDCIANGNDY